MNSEVRDAPERIWLCPQNYEAATACGHPSDTEYVRADLLPEVARAALIAELQNVSRYALWQDRSWCRNEDERQAVEDGESVEREQFADAVFARIGISQLAKSGVAPAVSVDTVAGSLPHQPESESSPLQDVDRCVKCPECGHGYEYSHLYADKPNPCSKIIEVKEVNEAQLAALHQEFRDDAGMVRCGHKCVFPSPSVSEAEDKNSSEVGKDLATQPVESSRPAQQPNLSIYVASRASVPERGEMWRRFRSEGFRITSSWIDEDGDGTTQDFTDLWQRISDEIAEAYGVVLYAEASDFPLKGALIEVGIALGLNKPVIVCLPHLNLDTRSCRPIGSWINHPMVSRKDNVREAMNAMQRGEVW